MCGMIRKVNFEGKQIPVSQLPHGCLFIGGVWYSGADTLPPELKGFSTLFKQSRKSVKISAVCKKALSNSSGVDLLTEMLEGKKDMPNVPEIRQILDRSA